ncbi:hypothetical protein POCGH01_00079000 [Plasmodium ovale]|uniref:PIR protein n=1 Tax=Plasmodium ovale TaxID=36330 RepID=A0A1D3JBM9_PLAOA|nr:hypothetical protein POCGH01_00079000 [Plasmodium ovale]
MNIFENLIILTYLRNKINKLDRESASTSRNAELSEEAGSSYKDNLNECHSGSNKIFCNELEKFRESNNKHLPTAKECNDVKTILPSRKKDDFIFLCFNPIFLNISNLFYFIFCE